jgi:hypothetical protein
VNERELRERLGELHVPDAGGAEERGARLASAAFAERGAATPGGRKRRRVRAAAAGASLAAVVAIALTPPGAALGDWISDVVGTGSPSSRPALTSLPTGGRLLVESAGGPWVVRRDGSKRRLGGYREAGWSPGGLFAVVASRRQLAAVEPGDGSVRWTLARAGPVARPAWSPDGFRIAYLSGRELRVVAGDGTGDAPLARADPAVTPSWRPDGRHVLAYVDERGRIAVAQTDSGRTLWRAARGVAPRELLWTADARRLVAIFDTAVEVFASDGRTLRTIALADGTLAGDAAIHPDGDTLALARSRPATGQGEIVTHSLRGPAAGGDERARPLFTGHGSFEGLAWSPDGRWLLAGWPAADQWLFVRSAQVRQVRAIGNIRRQFAPGRPPPARFPRIEGWCCRR